MPITPGSTGVPSMRWSSRNGWAFGSRVVSTSSPPCRRKARTEPTRGPAAATAAGSRPPASSHSCTRTPRRPAITISPAVPPAVSSRRITGMALAAFSMSMPAASIIFGIEPRVAMPMSPQAVQSMAMPRVPGRVCRKAETLLQSRSLADA